MVEITEEEFLIIIKSRINKALIVGDLESYQQHKNMYELYKDYKKKGYVCKFYLEGDALYLIGYTPKEYEIILRKYRESGIW